MKDGKLGRCFWYFKALFVRLKYNPVFGCHEIEQFNVHLTFLMAPLHYWFTLERVVFFLQTWASKAKFAKKVLKFCEGSRNILLWR